MSRLAVPVVLARENTLDDIRAIRAAAPELGLETFIHGALCIAYSGQCFMSGMISERSANRGSCAQSCRKDYVLTDVGTGEELDRGFLISAKDLAAAEHLADIADAGVGCLKVEGRGAHAFGTCAASSGHHGAVADVGCRRLGRRAQLSCIAARTRSCELCRSSRRDSLAQSASRCARVRLRGLATFGDVHGGRRVRRDSQ